MRCGSVCGASAETLTRPELATIIRGFEVMADEAIALFVMRDDDDVPAVGPETIPR
jgi:hypothetical protein